MTAQVPYADREQAGRVLAEDLSDYAGRDDTLVLALPRGGVPVAYEVARAIGAPLDLLLVRKLGLPGHEELAMGAIATGGAQYINPQVVSQAGVDQETIERLTERERQELNRREQTYRGDREPPAIEGKVVILVDDGLATGATMLAAINALRGREPAQLVVAVPVAPPDTVTRVAREVDHVACPAQPAAFGGVGRWYRRFDQTTDDQVRQRLHNAWDQEASHARG